MPISLNIVAESVEEFDKLIGRFYPAGHTMPELLGSTASGAVATADTPTPVPARKRGGKASADTTSTEASGTDANATVTASTPAASNGAATAGETAIEEAGNAGEPSEPAGTASVEAAATTAGEGGDVNMQQLKDAMSALIKAKSAAVAMQTLANATGCKSLTSGSPSVAEKVAEDPGIMQRALTALLEAAK